MIQYKQDIKCPNFEARMRKALKEVDELKHATPQAKKEFYDLLIRMRDDLINWKTETIDIPEFMRRETR